MSARFFTQGLRALRSRPVFRPFSDSITYSGGQATSGQGGFYGSGGSRVTTDKPEHHLGATARLQDVLELNKLMLSIDTMESDLLAMGDKVTSQKIELKARIKKTISNPHVARLLDKLEIRNEPVWGLSAKERDLVRSARDKYRAS
mmetsp:Transcript_33597/g.74054  ORF Transcript_33597/g.74054 Transcript_33597/m.74054 type:complete len:146 (+) Transcript_33597:145-582(+)